jgi:hypothetical protein
MEPNDFEQLLKPYQNIKDGPSVKGRLDFYKGHVNSKRRAAKYSGHTILLFSLLIPVVTTLPFKDHWVKGLIVSILSLIIALITGIRESTQWARLWRVYSQAQRQIETLIDSWEMEIARARPPRPLNLTEATDILERATNTLKDSVLEIVEAESNSFFSATPLTPQTQGQHGKQTAAKRGIQGRL